MSNDAEKDLSAFLAALPVYKRKQFELGFSSFTQDDMNLWTEGMKADAPEQSTECLQEFLRLLQRVPTKLREYREREIRDFAQNMTALSLLPSNSEGRPRKNDLADEALKLKEAGLSYAQIAMRLNREHGEDTATGESVRKLLKSRTPKVH
jgi:hypothetical protein